MVGTVKNSDDNIDKLNNPNAGDRIDVKVLVGKGLTANANMKVMDNINRITCGVTAFEAIEPRVQDIAKDIGKGISEYDVVEHLYKVCNLKQADQTRLENKFNKAVSKCPTMKRKRTPVGQALEPKKMKKPAHEPKKMKKPVKNKHTRHGQNYTDLTDETTLKLSKSADADVIQAAKRLMEIASESSSS